MMTDINAGAAFAAFSDDEWAGVISGANGKRPPTMPAADDTGQRPGRPAASRAPDNGQETHRSHLRMAERMATEHGGHLRYAHGLGWLVWDGARWKPDTDGEPMRRAIEVVKSARRAAGKQDATLADDAKSAESASGLKGILEIARHLRPLAVAADRLDTDPYLLNCANGTVDLRTGEIKDHDPADLITRVAGCGYDPAADGPTFDRFLSEIFPLADVRSYVQRLAGYALLGKVTEHVLPIFTGTGCNGKTTLIELALKAFGDYGIMADPELLTEHPHGQHPTGQADLLGVRLAVMQETDAGRRLAVATVKRLTGGDKIRARKMRADFFEFDPSHTAVMVTNHKPRIPGDDPAAWRRVRVIPFDRVIEHPDPSLPDRLALELPAVLRWLIDGYRAYAESGLADPDIVTERTAAYRVSSDSMGRYLAECTMQRERIKTKARDLFESWREWCGQNGEVPGSEVEFSDSMAARGYDKHRTAKGIVYEGIGIVSDDAPGPDWAMRAAGDTD